MGSGGIVEEVTEWCPSVKGHGCLFHQSLRCTRVCSKKATRETTLGIGMEAQDIMTVDVDTVHEEDEVRDVLTRLGRVNYSGFPVIDDKGRVVGVVTEHDLVDVFQPHDKTLWIPIGFPPFLETMTYGFEIPWDEVDIGLDLYRLSRQSISELMTSPAITVTPDTPISQVIEVLADEEHDINRVPVITEKERITGIISRQDVLRVISDYQLVEL